MSGQNAQAPVDVKADERRCHCCGEPFARCRETYRGTSSPVDVLAPLLAGVEELRQYAHDDETVEIADNLESFQWPMRDVIEAARQAYKSAVLSESGLTLDRDDLMKLGHALHALGEVP